MKAVKRFKVVTAMRVNANISKNGITWKYRGKAEMAEEWITWFESRINKFREDDAKGYYATIGLRITNAETGEVVYEKMI